MQFLRMIFPAAAHERADARQQFLHRERLGQVIVCAFVQPLYTVVHFGFGRQQQYGRCDIVCPHVPQDLKTGYLWHHNIENDTIVSVLPDERERFFSVVSGIHIIMLHRQDGHQRVVEVFCIFRKQ